MTAPAAGTDAATLRHRAGVLAGGLPPLLADASQLAATVMLGEHGRRRAGTGDEFWQYRGTVAGDSARMIDWRRSARSDAQYVREREWQAAQSVQLWVDGARSMAFSGDPGRAPKSHRAGLLALAVAILLSRAGERVGLLNAGMVPRAGQSQIARIAEALAGERASDGAQGDDYGTPDSTHVLARGRAVFLSDFLGPIEPVAAAVTSAADRGVRGVLLQLLDPVEEAFPFDGRTVFESMSGTLRHESLRAGDLRDRYVARLAQRKERLARLARATGWHYSSHQTGEPALGALMWIYHALERVR